MPEELYEAGQRVKFSAKMVGRFLDHKYLIRLCGEEVFKKQKAAGQQPTFISVDTLGGHPLELMAMAVGVEGLQIDSADHGLSTQPPSVRWCWQVVVPEVPTQIQQLHMRPVQQQVAATVRLPQHESMGRAYGQGLIPSREPPHDCALGRLLSTDTKTVKPNGSHRRPFGSLCYPVVAERLPSGTLVNKAAAQSRRAAAAAAMEQQQMQTMPSRVPRLQRAALLTSTFASGPSPMRASSAQRAFFSEWPAVITPCSPPPSLRWSGRRCA